MLRIYYDFLTFFITADFLLKEREKYKQQTE